MTNNSPFLWTRTSDLRNLANSQEVWTLKHGNTVKNFDVNVTFGKPIDIKSIKKDWPFKAEVEFCNRMRLYFEDNQNFVPVEKCPICGSDRSNAKKEHQIWNQFYYVCQICGHAFLHHFPDSATAENFYASTISTSGYYTNEQDIEFRLAQIYRPKIEWIIDRYRHKYGHDPASIFDFGAGTGHILYAARQKGISAYGVERDPGYRNFCKENFGISLYSLPEEYRDRRFDVVMSFNVIEHVDDPFAFLTSYKELLSDQPLAIVETPKYNSVTSVIQSVFKNKIRGHLVPYQHNHMFSDSSLSTLFYLNSLDISDAWIFGNDAIELILQFADEVDVSANDLIDRLYLKLQKCLDRSMASDIMILAGVPST